MLCEGMLRNLQCQTIAPRVKSASECLIETFLAP